MCIKAIFLFQLTSVIAAAYIDRIYLRCIHRWCSDRYLSSPSVYFLLQLSSAKPTLFGFQLNSVFLFEKPLLLQQMNNLLVILGMIYKKIQYRQENIKMEFPNDLIIFTDYFNFDFYSTVYRLDYVEPT